MFLNVFGFPIGLYQIIKKQRAYLYGFILAILLSISLLIGPYLLRLIIDGIENGLNSSLILPLLGGIILITVLAGGIERILRYNNAKANRQVEYELRKVLFAHILSLKSEEFAGQRVGDLAARLTADLASLQEQAGFFILQLQMVLARLGLSLIALFVLDWPTTLILIVVAAAVMLLFAYLSKKIRLLETKKRELIGQLTADTQETITGIRTIRSLAYEENFIDRYRALNERSFAISQSLANQRGLQAALTNTFVYSFLIIATLLLGQRIIFQQTDGLGSLVQYLTYVSSLVIPLLNLINLPNIRQTALAAWQRLEKIYSLAIELSADEQEFESNIKLSEPIISFRNVNYRINDKILLELDLDIQPANLIGITGRVGSGKTIFVKLLSGFIRPTSGQITINNHNIIGLSNKTWRRTIAIVPQEAFLFSTTIEENIKLGTSNERFKAELLEKAISLACLDEFLPSLADGLQTVVGERGVTLSGGQRQRVALARALIADPAILVIDDALRSIDAGLQHRVLEGLRQHCRNNKTLIVVSHQPSVLIPMDTILVFEQGLLVERGAHSQLLAKNGVYTSIFQEESHE